MAKSKCNKLEDYMRRHNLIFDGLTEVQGETREMLMKKVLDAFRQMGMKDLNEIKLENFHRLPSTKKGVPKPVIVRFCFMADRIRVWQNRKNLKGSKIFLREDFATETLSFQREVLPLMKIARSKGHKSIIVADKILFDGKGYDKNHLHLLPSELQMHKIASRSDGKCLAFFSKHNPLSNFYQATFKYGGQWFSSSEQAFQYKKACYFNDHDTAHMILEEDNPANIKRLGNKTRGFNEAIWNEQAVGIMNDILKHKFEQCPTSKVFYLLETKDMTLIESSEHDKFWGSGYSLNHDKCLDYRNLPGENILAKVLMSIRDSYEDLV